MNKRMAWLCLIGGILWGVKPIYDALVNGREINTGYIPVDPTDYIKFIFPFLCLSGLLVIYSRYKKKVRNSVIVLFIAVVFNGLFHFFEIYFYDSDLPFGFIFLFFGMFAMIAGSLYLFIQLRKIKGMSGFLTLPVFILFLSNFLLVVLAFLMELLPVTIPDLIMATLMISVGFIWAWIGMALLKVGELESSIHVDV